MPVKAIFKPPLLSFATTTNHIKTDVKPAVTSDEAEENKNDKLKKFVPDDFVDKLLDELTKTYEGIEADAVIYAFSPSRSEAWSVY